MSAAGGLETRIEEGLATCQKAQERLLREGGNITAKDVPLNPRLIPGFQQDPTGGLQWPEGGAIASPKLTSGTPKTTERAYDRPSPETAALATLYAGLKREDCQWFKGPDTDEVLGKRYTRLAIPDTTAAGAIAHFIVAFSEWLDGARQVAWRDYPTLERHPDGHVSVVAVFAAWKGE